MTTLSGTVLGADGKPMKKAGVYAMQIQSTDEKPRTAEVRADGTFALELPYGWHLLEFTGTDHQRERTSMMYFINPGMSLRCTLASNAPKGPIDSVTCVTSLDGYSFDKQRAMKKQADGSWRLEMPVDAATKEIGYQVIMYVRGESDDVHSVNSTEGTGYEYDGGGDYRSIVPVVNGRATLTFTPALLPRSKRASEVAFLDTYGVAAKRIIDEQRSDLMKSFTAGTEVADGKTTTWNAAKRRSELAAAIIKEAVPTLRQLRMISYLSLRALPDEPTGVDTTVVDRIFSTIAPASLIWDNYADDLVRFTRMGGATSKGYADRVLNESPSANVKASILYDRLSALMDAKRDAEARAVYDRLVKEFAKTFPAQRAKRELTPSRAVKVGAPLPAFAFQSLEDSTINVTNAGIKGKWVLVDNWATWCGPCVSEMGALHAAYEKFKDKNFTILSVSFDRGTAEIVRFRNNKWKMPWMHCFSPGVWKNDASRIFEVNGIPKPILVAPDGTIVA
ncbi:MAG: thioredoxin-like domain-containing protein, partial [Candidatus Kapaibacterium sp.]